MIKITREQVSEHSVHEFVAEASELGWPPGLVPREIMTDLGNGQNLLYRRSFPDNGGWAWTQANGCVTLTVFND